MKTLKTVTSIGIHLVMVSLLASCSTASQSLKPDITAAPSDNDYTAAIEAWRDQRESRLSDPEGWLSFAGSGQVSTGTQTVGSDIGNVIVLTSGPKTWGTLHLEQDGTLYFDAAPNSGLKVDGHAFERVRLLHQLDEGGPTSVHSGKQRFYVVKTGDVYGWRLRDPDAAGLKAFNGVPNFPIDASWRIDARWEPFDPPRTIELLTSNGTVDDARVPGQAVFERDGRQYTLWPVHEEGDTELFFIVADRTSGKESYGGGRFLYAALPKEGRVELDFNKAVNPPCALNGHVVCPLAPPENRLDLRITAGEKTYPLHK